MTAMFDLAADLVELTLCAPPADVVAPLREMPFRANAWTVDELDTLRTMFAADETIDAIAVAVGRGRAGVADKIYSLGLRRNSSRPWLDLEDQALMQRYGTVAAARLAGEFGRSCAAVYARAQILGLTEGNPPPYEPWEDAQIREAYARGVPVGQIATLLGRGMSGVSSRAGYLGLRHLNKPDDWSEAEAQRALELAEEGHRYAEIMAQLVAEGFPQRSASGFGQRLRKLGYGRGWGRPWIGEEDELLRHAYATGASLTPLRHRLGRTPCSIRWRVHYLGLQGTHEKTAGWRTAPAWTPEEDARLRADYGKMDTGLLAEQLGRKRAGIMQRAAVLGIRHGYIRSFTADERRAIGIAWRRGLSLSDLADALGRDVAVVSKHAIKLELRFNSPDRPMRGPKGRRDQREKLTLAGILAMEAPDPAVDGAIEEINRRNESRAARNRGASSTRRAKAAREAQGIPA